ncbi:MULTISPECIES: hypothetical protein [unclassified Streptomyces]|uniref:hypothetical protein n=1 Tax=unclassified Streptomyces TaxID=2593676 RepID=UPI0028877133|nr:hypothetical protein [Streptomyces sp. DSM 41633]
MDGLAEDIHWAGARRSAICTAALFLAALLVLDAGAGELCVLRVALWAGLAALLFVILLPPRVSVRAGRLSTRGLLVGHSVRTDSLASLQWCDGVAQRVVLRDTEGSSVEIDPTVLTRNPAMWRRLDADTRTSVERGTLLLGSTALRRLAEHIDRETARTVFRVSGLR